MSGLKQVIRLVLVLHGLLNVVQGAYSVLKPTEFAKAAGVGFEGAPDKAIQSIGMGSIGVGIYGASGAIQSTRRFYTTTALLRLLLGTIALTQWGWDTSSGVIIYELAVAATAAVGALT